MKAVVDEDLCIGCKLCVVTCPEVFKIDESIDKAIVIVNIIPKNIESSAQQAAQECPVDAIKIE